MDLLKEYWAQLVAGVALIMWALRVESQTKTNASEIKRLWHQRSEDLAAHRAAREETNDLLAEMRADIKTLLSRMGK